MTESPRVLAIMGSGETSPTMVKTHRENIARFEGKKPLCVILDTPFGFQSNADEIGAKAIEYFRVSVNVEAEIASFRSSKIDPLEQEKFFSKLQKADYIFAGPGSPTFALRQWANTPVPQILINKLVKGPGVITFSSAAALTLGSRTVPVYEIYKVGDDPDWIHGLDILGRFGIKGAVIPHFNNAEGGSHDTRFSYLGEERLESMEARLKPDESVFGIDEHTAIVIDLDAEKVSVAGNGTFNIRNQGRQATFEAGMDLPLSALVNPEALFRATGPSQVPKKATQITEGGESDHPTSHGGMSPLLATVEELQASFDDAVLSKDMDAATKAALSLHTEIGQWQNETFQSDEMEQANSALRAMIVRLGELAVMGIVDPQEIFGPFVDLVLRLRMTAREHKRWDESDQIRDELAKLGIEVRDISGGSEWISIGNK
ncbi:MAG: hypothetical protein EPN30_10490 [Actinomycetota bacterium]|nr:MAG: hypothetical protein EPN30_10490 [Actinomycetota bacterium]